MAFAVNTNFQITGTNAISMTNTAAALIADTCTVATSCDLGTAEALWHNGSSNVDGILAARHGGHANIGFFDGHVASLDPADFVNNYVIANNKLYTGTPKGVHYADGTGAHKTITW